MTLKISAATGTQTYRL